MNEFAPSNWVRVSSSAIVNADTVRWPELRMHFKKYSNSNFKINSNFHFKKYSNFHIKKNYFSLTFFSNISL